MEQLLLVTSCDSPAGIGASLRTHTRTNGWTDRRDVGNSILDIYVHMAGKGSYWYITVIYKGRKISSFSFVQSLINVRF